MAFRNIRNTSGWPQSTFTHYVTEWRGHVPLAFGAIVFRRWLQVVCQAAFQVVRLQVTEPGPGANRSPQSFETTGEIRDYAVFARCRGAGSSCHSCCAMLGVNDI